MNEAPDGFALELRHVAKSFGRSEIVRGVSLAVRRGERVALIGPNGAGKSTLFDLISGRTPLGAGEVLLDGRRVDGLAPHRIHRLGLARSFQVSNLFGRLSVFENLRCAALWSRGYGYSFRHFLSGARDANERAEDVLQRVGLVARRDRLAATLSYAEQRALEIGLTLAGDAAVVMFDEPTAGMSRSETARFVPLIRGLTEGRTLLMVEHDMGVVFELADRVAVLVQGQLLAFDTPQAVRDDPRVREAYLGVALEHLVGEAG